MQAARGEPHEGIPLGDAMRPEPSPVVHHPDAEPGEVELPRAHHARMLRRLAAEQRAAGAPAALRNARHDRGDLVGHEPADGHVVEEEQRLGARAHDVVGAHRDQVDADRVQAPGHPRHLELGPDAVGGGGEEAILRDPEQPREPADSVRDLGPRGAPREVPDAADGLGGGVEVDAGPPVRLVHRGGYARSLATRSLLEPPHPAHDFAGCSSRNLPACSGIGIGYSPSKHARQKPSRSWPVAATIPSSDR